MNMVEKHVKIFSIRLTKLQRAVGDLNEVVKEYLIDQNADDMDETPEYKLKAIKFMVLSIDTLLQDMRRDYALNLMDVEDILKFERWRYQNP